MGASSDVTDNMKSRNLVTLDNRTEGESANGARERKKVGGRAWQQDLDVDKEGESGYPTGKIGRPYTLS